MRLRPSVASAALAAAAATALAVVSAVATSPLAAQETASAPATANAPGATTSGGSAPGEQRLFYCQLQPKDGSTTYYSSVFPAGGSPVVVQDEWLAFVNARYRPGPVASSSCQTGSAAFLKQMRDLAANPKKKSAAPPVDTGWKLEQ
jgi:hypothetical protein